MWKVIYDLLGEEMLENGKIIIALDDTTYGKSGRKIAGANTHYDHAAKQNCSKYVWGHCRVVIGILKTILNFDGICSKAVKRAGNLILNSFFREVA